LPWATTVVAKSRKTGGWLKAGTAQAMGFVWRRRPIPRPRSGDSPLGRPAGEDQPHEAGLRSLHGILPQTPNVAAVANGHHAHIVDAGLSHISGHPRPDKDLEHNRAQTFSGDVDYRSLQDKDEGNISTIGAFLQAGGLLTPCCPSGYDSARGSACP